MNAVTTDTIVRDVRAAIEPHPAVREVRLIGSRARGDAGPLSDWDFEVVTGDFDSAARDIESATAELTPLAAQWDRLSPHMCYMLILPGAVKVDLLFLDRPHELEPPWDVKAATLPGIDAHVWDWALWLASKESAGKCDLVADELRKLSEHILSPMGVEAVPANLKAAIELYIEARDRLEAQFHVRVQRELSEQVLRRLREHGYEL